MTTPIQDERKEERSGGRGLVKENMDKKKRGKKEDQARRKDDEDMEKRKRTKIRE